MLVPVLIALAMGGRDVVAPPSSDAGTATEAGRSASGKHPKRWNWQDPHDTRAYTIGTSDSAALVRWFEHRRWSHISLGEGLFEVRVPSDSLEALASLPLVERIEAAPRHIRDELDPSRALIQAEPVHNGVGIAHAHHGTQVLVGVIDVGFDLQHPAFQDSAGDSRIVRVWDQTNTTGRPPSGFTAGTLFATPTAIRNLGHTGTSALHGTHVAGLAAGRSWPAAGGDWWGVADDARLALVDCGEGCQGLNNGLKYLFRLADSLELPVVVNMSWGNLNGPRNGNSTDCVLAQSLVGPGKIAVVSAGNSGGMAAHASHAFQGDTARFALQVSEGTQTLSSGKTRTVYYNEVELWGDSAKTYQAWMEYLDADDSVLAKSAVFAVGTSKSTWINIDSRVLADKDTMWYAGNIEKRSGQANLRLSVSTSRQNTQMRLAVTAATGTVHGWIWEEGLEFLAPDPTRCKGCVAPDSAHMISDKATCPALIAVGAYNGYNGYKVWWSSRGPGLGAVPKPDIAAPGVEVISALNSAGPSSTISGTLGGYSWGPLSGTSMSAPLVAGAVALLLENNPKLTTDSIVGLFKGGRLQCDPDTGWAKLDVLGLFQTVDPVSATALRNRTPSTTPTVRTWILPDGRRIAVPVGARAAAFHPGGLAWLQSCEGGNCTTRGMLKP
jgi:minor extracellular serine protease Vpr